MQAPADCPICRKPLKGLVATLPACRHVFHPWCEFHWRREHDKCFLCEIPRKAYRPIMSLAELFDLMALIDQELSVVDETTELMVRNITALTGLVQDLTQTVIGLQKQVAALEGPKRKRGRTG